MTRKIASINPAQIKTLTTGKNSDWDLPNFRRRKDKLYMFRWFFKCLKQAIESLSRQHMNLIDNIDFIASRDRLIANLFNYFTNIVDTRVRGRIHLDHINMTAIHDRLTMFAELLNIYCRLVNTIFLVIERTRKNTSGCGFTHPANTCQHPSLRNSP